METPIDIIVWNPSKKEEKLLRLIENSVRDKLKEKNIKAQIEIIDASSESIYLDNSPKLIFGQLAYKHMEKNKEEEYISSILPDLKTLLADKDKVPKAKEEIDIFVDLIEGSLEEEPENEKKSYVELSDGTTVGLIGTDIVISEDEAEALRKIKNLFNDGRIVIEKGDLKIIVEIENE